MNSGCITAPIISCKIPEVVSDGCSRNASCIQYGVVGRIHDLLSVGNWLCPMIDLDKFGPSVLRGLVSLHISSDIFVVLHPRCLTGNASGDASSSPFLVNKMLLSGLCLGLWIGVIHGRYAWGLELWSERKKGIFHVVLVSLGYGTAAMLGSIGSLMTRGETVGDLIGIWPHLESAPSLSFGISVTLAMLSLIALLVVIFIQPKSEKMSH